jgi:ABC-2 type transport system ATP-binding protein
MIDTNNLIKKFGNITAVENLTIHIKEGEVFGFLGPNGAGKTTTLRMLGCLISRSSGSAQIKGYDIGNKADQLKIRKILGVLPENVGLYEDLSAYKNLDFYGRLFKCTKEQRKERIEYYLKGLGLWGKRNRSAGTFSKGMKQKLAIARALIHDPLILFLDEPTANLDPEASKTVRDFILELKKEKRTIILNTHLLDEAEKICDRVGILKTKLIVVDSPKRLKQSLWGRKTIIQLVSVNDAILTAVRQIGSLNVEKKENKLII